MGDCCFHNDFCDYIPLFFPDLNLIFSIFSNRESLHRNESLPNSDLQNRPPPSQKAKPGASATCGLLADPSLLRNLHP